MTETAKERIYREAPDNLIGNFDTSETLTVTMPMEEFDKLQNLALSAHTDKLSVEKLQEENNKLHNEIARLSNQTQVDYKLAYEESEKQLNTAKKACRACYWND